MRKHWTTIRVITMRGDPEEKNDMLDWCHANGYKVKSCGPRKRAHHVYQVVAQKVLKDGAWTPRLG